MIKPLLGVSAVFGIAASVLGFMSHGKLSALKDAKVAVETQLASTQDNLDKTTKKLTDTEGKLATAVTELEEKKEEIVRVNAELQSEKSRLAEKVRALEATESKIAELTKELETEKLKSATVGVEGGAPGVPQADLQTKVADLTQQLEAAEAEKKLLAEQVRGAAERVEALQQAETNRQNKLMARGLTGRVMAVNQAWNFVVLNMGDRQGVTENGEMLIRRGNVMIGKIRISSVEPSTSIGDIIPSSVPKGMQVQPGDTVVYPGS